MTAKPPFEDLVQAHGPTVLRVCRAVLGSHPDAEDAWSETFLSALRAYPGLREPANHRAWLVTIAHRKAIDVTRARARGAVPVGEVPERRSAHGIPEDGDGDVWRLVAALPDKQRAVLAYRYLGGLDYAAIAGLVGGSADAARRAATDGMTTLRAQRDQLRVEGEVR
ncbi:MAG: sigma-70 family RNA polymerase sigma factor [Dermatophilaceae bacterium]